MYEIPVPKPIFFAIFPDDLKVFKDFKDLNVVILAKFFRMERKTRKNVVYLPEQRFHGRRTFARDEKGIGCKSRTVLAAVSLIFLSFERERAGLPTISATDRFAGREGVGGKTSQKTCLAIDGFMPAADGLNRQNFSKNESEYC